jgi:ubiquinone/menaquinone biosynthesis C-methylase UbiE
MRARRPVATEAPRFDAQADRFDRRAGLPREAVEAIAAAVVATCAPTANGVLLEIGAGTGEIGAVLAVASPMPYLGLDLSLAMLARFRSRVQGPSTPSPTAIVEADADRPWPLAAGRARIVFVSRALHLLDLERVVDEARRVAHPRGCALVVGRVRRQPASVRSMLRRQMRSLLAARGITGRSGEHAAARLGEALARHGALTRPPLVAAGWTVDERPAQILAGWRGKPGLAGVAMPREGQAAVLDELEAWALDELGDLDAPHAARDEYELTVIDLPSHPGSARP